MSIITHEKEEVQKRLEQLRQERHN